MQLSVDDNGCVLRKKPKAGKILSAQCSAVPTVRRKEKVVKGTGREYGDVGTVGTMLLAPVDSSISLGETHSTRI